MAIRLDAATDALTGNGLTGSVATICLWMRVAVDRNDYSNAVALRNSGTAQAWIGTDADGTTMVAFDAPFTAITGPSMTVGTWYCVGLICNGTSWTLRYGTSPNSMTTVGPSTRTAISSPNQFGVSNSAGEWWNGDVAALRVYSRALSNAEITAELLSNSPVSSTNLIRSHAFVTSPGTTNEGGSGNNLTAGSTATATSTGPAALDVLTGAVTSAVTAGASVTGTAESFGAVTSAVAAGSTVVGTADHVGTAGSSVVAGSTVTGVVESYGSATSTVTAGATVVGEATGVDGVITSTITAVATVTGAAEHVGELGSAITAGTSVVGSVESYGVVSSAVTATVLAAGVDLNAAAVLGPLRAGVPVLAAGWSADDPVLTSGWAGGQPVLAGGWRAGTPS